MSTQAQGQYRLLRSFPGTSLCFLSIALAIIAPFTADAGIPDQVAELPGFSDSLASWVNISAG